MLGKMLQADIAELIAARDFESLKIALDELPPADVAEILIDLPDEDEAVLYRLMPRKLAAEAFSHLPPANQGDPALAAFPRDAGQHPSRHDARRPHPAARGAARSGHPALADGAVARCVKVTRQLLGYPEGSIGRLMTPEYVTIKMDMTVADVLGAAPQGRLGQGDAQRPVRDRRPGQAHRRHPAGADRPGRPGQENLRHRRPAVRGAIGVRGPRARGRQFRKYGGIACR